MKQLISCLRIPTFAAALGTLVALALPAWSSQDAGQEKKKENEKPAAEAALGKPAPAFELKDVDGKTVKLADFKGKTVVIEWFNPACPFCVYAYSDKGPLRTMPEDLQKKGIVWLSIVSEKTENSGGKVETITEFMKKNGMKIPMLLDPDGKVGRAYGAKTTPHMFVIDGKGVLVYRGALDNAPFGNLPKDETLVNHVTAALADLEAKREVQTPETKAYG